MSAPPLDSHTDWRPLHLGEHSDLWSALQQDFGRRVAVKVFHAAPRSRALASRRAGALGRVSGLLRTVPLLSLTELSDGRIAMVLPLFDGSILDHVGRMSVDDWGRWFIEACEAVATLHAQGLAHGNIRPGNILVSGDRSIHLTDHDLAGPGASPVEDAVTGDLRALVSAFAAVAPPSVVSTRVITMLGGTGEHLGDLGLDSPRSLTHAIDQELRRSEARPDPANDRQGRTRSALVGIGAAVLLAVTGLLVWNLASGTTDPEPPGHAEDSDRKDASSEASAAPRPPVEGIATNISVSNRQACSLLSDGTAACWGSGLLLEDTDRNDPEAGIRFDRQPFAVQGGPFAAVDLADDGTGNEALCAVSGGRVFCRGWSLAAPPAGVAEEDLNRADLLYEIPGILSAIDVAVGAEHACALLADSTVRCFGSDLVGQLGDGSPGDRAGNGLVPGLTDVTGLTAGGEATCALKSDGSVWCWGHAVQDLAQPSAALEPVKIEGLG